MSYSLEAAKAIIYETILHRRDDAPPEDTPRIFDEDTIPKTWGWIFFYNSERCYQTRDMTWCWVGPGPIFFNKHTGEIRRYGSGGRLDDDVYDYEMALAAENGSWCLWLADEQPLKPTILKIKAAFEISTVQARALVPKLPHCLFSGIRRHLDFVSQKLKESGVMTNVTLEESKLVAQSVFTLSEQLINPTLAEAYHGKYKDYS